MNQTKGDQPVIKVQANKITGITKIKEFTTGRVFSEEGFRISLPYVEENETIQGYMSLEIYDFLRMRYDDSLVYSKLNKGQF